MISASNFMMGMSMIVLWDKSQIVNQVLSYYLLYCEW